MATLARTERVKAKDMGTVRVRTVRMSDLLWEAMGARAAEAGMPIGEAVRQACEAWLGEPVDDGRRLVVPVDPQAYRQVVRKAPKPRAPRQRKASA